MAGRKNRLRVRAAIAAVGFVIGNVLAPRFGWSNPFLAGLLLGAAAGGVDLLIAWRAHERTAVWRGKRRGEVRTGRLLRLMLSRSGYRVMDGRAVPGKASIDHLIIGPNGLWIVDNEAWGPDTVVARYGGRLFFNEKFGTTVAKGLIQAATALADLLTKETGIPVSVAPVLALHGCRIEGYRGIVAGEGLTVAYPRKVARVVRSEVGTRLSAEQIDLLARTAARILARPSPTRIT
ncbi:nuclease-related domain-containing protein [Acrocarpospora catenulata]|uniref:nuclease-related domain-containing protein n=1 Tax=Acrocarpospora catenulata TaxID=2836182 RepID=UPI002023950E|nr:nuclease-related domain-containing protein [Acrocarpospora catenulata]